MFDAPTLTRLDEALKKLLADYEKRGERRPGPDQSLLLAQGAKYLHDPNDQMTMYHMLYMSAKTAEDKNALLDHARSLSQQHGGNLSARVDYSLFFPLAAEFYSRVSKQEYQNLVAAHPLTYQRNLTLLAERGLDTSIVPSPQAFDAAIKRLSEEDYSFDLLKLTTDPDMRRKMAAHLVSLGYNNERILDPEYAPLIKDIPGGHEILLTALRRIDSEKVLRPEYAPLIKELPGGHEILLTAFRRVSGYPFEHDRDVPAGSLKLNEYLLEKYGPTVGLTTPIDTIMLQAARKDPLVGISFAAKRYPESAQSIPMYMASLPRAGELLDNPIHAAQVVQLLNKLEPSQYAGQRVALVPEKEVFRLLDGASAAQLYDLIAQQQTPETYSYTQGTYNEISKRFYEALKTEKKSFNDIIDSSDERKNTLPFFIQAAADMQRLDALITATPSNAHQLIAETLMTPKEGEQFNVSTISSFLQALPAGHPSVKYFESRMIELALNGNEYTKADMGILSSWYANQGKHTISPEHKPFYDRVKNDPSFQIPPLNSIKSNQLLDAAGRNFQLHVFYNDKDGIDTFKSFSSSLQADGWSKKKQDGFLIYAKEQNGKKSEILVSPPETDGAEIDNIKNYVKSKNGVISVLSGRGHSHHMAEVVDLVTPDVKIVALGGCWGHSYISSVLKRSPQAHILATTGIGRMSINNANSRWLNEQVLSGRDLDWRQLEKEWGRMRSDRAIAQDLQSYVAPHQNTMLLYLRRQEELYLEINQRSQESEPASQLQSDFMNSVRKRPSAQVLPTAVVPTASAELTPELALS